MCQQLFYFQGSGCNFNVNEKRHMTAKVYVVIIVFIILRELHINLCCIIVLRFFLQIKWSEIACLGWVRLIAELMGKTAK